MNRRPGFTLIEILIGIALSSLLGVALFQSFYQTNRTATLIDVFVDIDTSSSLIVHQFEKDIVGATVVRSSSENKDKETKEKQTKIVKQFYATVQEKNFALLTFITTNPLLTYASSKQRLVRVVYRLRKNKDNDLYMLTRQESENLDFDFFEGESTKKPREIVLSKLVQACSFEYLVTSVSKEDKQQKVKTYPEWNSDGNKKEKLPSLLPAWIRMRLIIKDSSLQRSRSINYLMPLYAYTGSIEKKGESQKQQPSTKVITQSAMTGQATKIPTKQKRLSLAEIMMGGKP